jgi:hypothetical protein
VIGGGDTTMVWTPSWVSNLDLLDERMDDLHAVNTPAVG